MVDAGQVCSASKVMSPRLLSGWHQMQPWNGLGAVRRDFEGKSARRRFPRVFRALPSCYYGSSFCAH